MPEYAWAQDAGYCQTGIAFKLNVEESLVGSKIDENRNSSAVEKDAFWVGYFLIAYQGEESEDADGTPANSGIVPGNAVCDCFSAGTCVGMFCASAIPKGGIGGLIYLEVMQDITRSYKLLGVTVYNQGVTAPHELGHQFGLKGDNMNPIVGQPPRANATYEIMDYPNRAGGQADSYTLHPEHINLIRRRVKSPGV